MFLKTEIASVTDHDMIKQGNAQHFACIFQTSSYIDIFLRGSRITAWMVVKKYKKYCIMTYSFHKDFTR